MRAFYDGELLAMWLGLIMILGALLVALFRHTGSAMEHPHGGSIQFIADARAAKVDSARTGTWLGLGTNVTLSLRANAVGGVGRAYALDGGLAVAAGGIRDAVDSVSGATIFQGNDFTSPRSGVRYLFAGWTVRGHEGLLKTRTLRLKETAERRDVTAHWLSAK